MATKDDKPKKKQSTLSQESPQKIRDNDNRVKPDKDPQTPEKSTDKILEAFAGLSSKLEGLTEKLEYHNNQLGRYNETLTQILKQAATPKKTDQSSEESDEKKKEDPFQKFRTIYHNLDQRSASQRLPIEPRVAGASLYPGGQKKDKERQIKQTAN